MTFHQWNMEAHEHVSLRKGADSLERLCLDKAQPFVRPPLKANSIFDLQSPAGTLVSEPKQEAGCVAK